MHKKWLIKHKNILKKITKINIIGDIAFINENLCAIVPFIMAQGNAQIRGHNANVSKLTMKNSTLTFNFHKKSMFYGLF